MVQVYMTLLIEVQKPWEIINDIQRNRIEKDIKCLDNKKIAHTYEKSLGLNQGRIKYRSKQ